MRLGLIAGVILWSGIMMITSGCSGLELGGKLGVYRVDDRVESLNTKTTHRPLKCMFVPCEEGYSNDK
jgi:hypothetical protein